MSEKQLEFTGKDGRFTIPREVNTIKVAVVPTQMTKTLSGEYRYIRDQREGEAGRWMWHKLEESGEWSDFGRGRTTAYVRERIENWYAPHLATVSFDTAVDDGPASQNPNGSGKRDAARAVANSLSRSGEKSLAQQARVLTDAPHSCCNRPYKPNGDSCPCGCHKMAQGAGVPEDDEELTCGVCGSSHMKEWRPGSWFCVVCDMAETEMAEIRDELVRAGQPVEPTDDEVEAQRELARQIVEEQAAQEFLEAALEKLQTAVAIPGSRAGLSSYEAEVLLDYIGRASRESGPTEVRMFLRQFTPVDPALLALQTEDPREGQTSASAPADRRRYALDVSYADEPERNFTDIVDLDDLWLRPILPVVSNPDFVSIEHTVDLTRVRVRALDPVDEREIDFEEAAQEARAPASQTLSIRDQEEADAYGDYLADLQDDEEELPFGGPDAFEPEPEDPGDVIDDSSLRIVAYYEWVENKSWRMCHARLVGVARTFCDQPVQESRVEKCKSGRDRCETCETAIEEGGYVKSKET